MRRSPAVGQLVIVVFGSAFRDQDYSQEVGHELGVTNDHLPDPYSAGGAQMLDWFADLSRNRRKWVEATRANGFESGIIGTIVHKYADPTHFVYELLQNAEDQDATEVAFVVEEDRLTFHHNGLPFTRGDVESITGIGNSEKPKQANKIGRFGVGFKSVFQVTAQPVIDCTLDGKPFRFAIEDLVVSVRLSND